MLKKLAFMLAITLATFTACKKDSTSSTVPTNSLTVNGGATENLTEVKETTYGYDLVGITTSGYNLTIEFMNGKPTSSGSVTLSATQTQPSIVILDQSNNGWVATSGTVNVTVSGTAVTATFSGVTFTGVNTNATGTPATLTATGSLYNAN